MIDFVQLINDSAEIPAEKKLELLDDYCAAFGYEESMGTKKDFANKMILDGILRAINEYRESVAREQLTYEEFKLSE